MQNVALIDYGSGNLRSAEKALVKAAEEAGHAAAEAASDRVGDVTRNSRIIRHQVRPVAGDVRHGRNIGAVRRSYETQSDATQRADD